MAKPKRKFTLRASDEHPESERLQCLNNRKLPGGFDYGVFTEIMPSFDSTLMLVERKTLPDLYHMALHDQERTRRQHDQASKAWHKGILCVLCVEAYVDDFFIWRKEAALGAVALSKTPQRLSKHQGKKQRVLEQVRHIPQGFKDAGWHVLIHPKSQDGNELEEMIADILEAYVNETDPLNAWLVPQALRNGVALSKRSVVPGTSFIPECSKRVADGTAILTAKAIRGEVLPITLIRGWVTEIVEREIRSNPHPTEEAVMYKVRKWYDHTLAGSSRKCNGQERIRSEVYFVGRAVVERLSWPMIQLRLNRLHFRITQAGKISPL